MGITIGNTIRTGHGMAVALFASITLGLTGIGESAHAGTFYRWFDADGVPHFSDQPPPPGARYTEQLPVHDYAKPRGSPFDDPYSIANQLQRLEAYRGKLAQERLERTRAEQEHRLRQREIELRERELDAPTSAPAAVYPRRYFGHRGVPRHRPIGPSHPTRPGMADREHPAFRPPYRPTGIKSRPPSPGSRITLGR